MYKGLLLAVAVACTASASQPVDVHTSEPIAIIDLAVNNGVLTGNVKNISSTPITAYAVIVRARNAQGANLDQGTAIDLPNPEHLPASAFAPGSSLRLKPMVLPKGAVGIPTIKVDYVRFIDGESWGEDSARESLRIQGMEAGLKAARSQLRSILRNKGPQAVV